MNIKIGNDDFPSRTPILTIKTVPKPILIIFDTFCKIIHITQARNTITHITHYTGMNILDKKFLIEYKIYLLQKKDNINCLFAIHMHFCLPLKPKIVLQRLWHRAIRHYISSNDSEKEKKENLSRFS